MTKHFPPSFFLQDPAHGAGHNIFYTPRHIMNARIILLKNATACFIRKKGEADVTFKF